jgi:hypothetical protein
MKTNFFTILFFLGFNSFAQSVSIFPNKAVGGQSFPVTISGKNTAFLTGVNTIDFIFNNAITTDAIFSNQNVLNDTVITGTVSISNNTTYPKFFYLRISNTINAPINVSNGIQIIDTDTIVPQIYILNTIGQFLQGGYSSLTIRGKNTHFETAQNNIVKIYKHGIESKSIAITNLRAIKTPHSNVGDLEFGLVIDLKTKIGPYTISVENEIDGKIFLNNAFNVVNPYPMSLINIEHKFARRNDQKEIYVVGNSNTKFKTNPPTILFSKNNSISNDVQITSFTTIDENNLIAIIKVNPSAELGSYSIAYFYPADQDTMYLNNYFSILARTGNKEIVKNNTKIFPNPVKNILNFESQNNISSVQIFDLFGKEIFNKIIEKETQNIQLAITDLQIPKGIFLVKLQSPAGTETQKIIIE